MKRKKMRKMPIRNYLIINHVHIAEGHRLNDRARSVEINGLSIDEVCVMELVDVLTFLLKHKR